MTTNTAVVSIIAFAVLNIYFMWKMPGDAARFSGTCAWISWACTFGIALLLWGQRFI